jgi:trans-aconitate methyltransferase
MDLIGELGVTTDTSVIDVGGGESRLAGHLLVAGFEDLTVLDVSKVALEEGHSSLGRTPVRWVEADVLAWQPHRRYGLWHDRAVFHFLVEPSNRAAYVDVLRAATEPGTAVVVGSFASDGEGCHPRISHRPRAK